MAVELNDRVIRQLFGTGLKLQHVTQLLTDSAALARVEAAIAELDTTISEIRSASYGWHTHPDAATS